MPINHIHVLTIQTKSFFITFALFCTVDCTKNYQATTDTEEVYWWVTSADKSALLQVQPPLNTSTLLKDEIPTITIDPAQSFQKMDGFGYTLTGGSAYLIQRLSPTRRSELLKEFFTNTEESLSINYLRISIGASDLDAMPFTYDDSESPDPDLQHFSMARDQEYLIPLLKQIIALQPSIKIIATPWTAPRWMKTNNSYVGGSLKPTYYDTYTRYFVRYIQAMQAEGITIDAITPQNEPENPHNNPSMTMTAPEQGTWIKKHLGPMLRQSGLHTKIILFDHNCDHPEYPISILDDAQTRQYVDGSAFHLYAGDISALSKVHDAHPDKKVYFTEQYISSKSGFGGDLAWHTRNVTIGATRNWASVVFEWNLAADPNDKPHTEGGCIDCLGAITIDGDQISRNTAYYIIGHLSRFVNRGSARIASNQPDKLSNVAFRTPDGHTVLLVLNESSVVQRIKVVLKGKQVQLSLKSGDVSTIVW